MVSRSVAHAFTFLPPLCSRYGASQLLWRLFHCSVQREAVDLPDSPHLNFFVVLSPTTRCLSMSASLRSFLSRSGLFPRQGRFSSAPFGSLGFAIQSQARQDIRPNRVPLVRTDRLASGCSPPHLRGPQLISPFGDAVTFGFQPVERLVERDLTSFSDVLSGARPRASRTRVTSTAGPERWRLAGWPGGSLP